LNQVGEAETFLREGLRANPLQPQLLFELGRIYHEDREDLARARNVWELALRSLDEMEKATTEPNDFLRAQILGNLAKLEEETAHYARAIDHLTKLEVISPHGDRIRQWIEELRAAEQAK
jgi:tetratricopeptide (TPR) repeat protein